MAENNKNVLKTVGVWAGIATIVAGIVVSAQFLYSLYQNRVILNVSLQPDNLVYFCGNRQSDKNCLNEEGYKFLKAIAAEAISGYSKDNEFVKIEINKEEIDNNKEDFKNSLSNLRIRVPFIIIISNNGNRDTTITKAFFDIFGYKGKNYNIEINNLLKKVKANSTEKIELAGITFGDKMQIPGEMLLNSFYDVISEFGKKSLGFKIKDKYDFDLVNLLKSSFIKTINDEIVQGDIIIKLVVEDQFGNRKTEALNLSSLPANLY